MRIIIRRFDNTAETRISEEVIEDIYDVVIPIPQNSGEADDRLFIQSIEETSIHYRGRDEINIRSLKPTLVVFPGSNNSITVSATRGG
jgi:hypothetical protein